MKAYNIINRARVIKCFSILLCISMLVGLFSTTASATQIGDEIRDEYQYHSTLYYDAENPYNYVYGNEEYAYECYISPDPALEYTFYPILFVHSGKIVRNAETNNDLFKIYFAQEGKNRPYFTDLLGNAQDFVKIAKAVKFGDIVEDASGIAVKSLAAIGAVYLGGGGGTVSVSVISDIVKKQVLDELKEHVFHIAQIITDAQLGYFYATIAEMESTISKLNDIKDFTSFRNCETYFSYAEGLVKARACATQLISAISADLKDKDSFLEAFANLALDAGSGFVGGFCEYTQYVGKLAEMQKNPDLFAKIVIFAGKIAECDQSIGAYQGVMLSIAKSDLSELFSVVKAYNARDQVTTLMMLFKSANKIALAQHPDPALPPDNSDPEESTYPTTSSNEKKWEGYTPISTKEELNAIRDNAYGKYYLTNNIYFTDLDFNKEGAYYNLGKGWDPINFYGLFDGNGYGIFGLQCKVTQSGSYITNYAGLFGRVIGATIKNLTVSGGKIYCEKNSFRLAYAGGIAAFCHDTTFINCHNGNDVQGYIAGGIAGACHGGGFENCTNSGSISGSISAATGDSGHLGGIVGTTSCNDPDCETVTMEIKNCRNFGGCGGYTSSAGGIVGFASMSEILLERCANYGSVGPNGTFSAGGIVANSYNDTIRYCYNAADVSGTKVGGIVGGNGYDNKDLSTITDCYNCGDIAAYGNYSYAGGICGDGGQVARCYNVGQITSFTTKGGYVEGIAGSGYNDATTTDCYSIYNVHFPITNGVRLCTEAEMKDYRTYRGFDFGTIWGCDPETNDGYPYLLDVLSSDDPSGAEFVSLSEYDGGVISQVGTRVLQVQLHVDGQILKETMLSDGFDYLITTSDRRVASIEYVEQHENGVSVTISGGSIGRATIRIWERSTGAAYSVDVEVKSHEEVGDHRYGIWYTVIGRTCATDGQFRRDCAFCDHYETEVLPAIGHRYTSVVTAPTCTEQGHTTHTCFCGASYVDSYVDAVGHSYENGICIICSAINRPVITQQPTSVVVKNGEKATVKVIAVGDGLTYRWYYKNKGDKDYTYTSTFTGNTYSVTMTDARAGRRVLCQVYDKYGNVVRSESVVLSQAVRITKQPTSIVVKNGEKATVKVTAVGEGLTYRWYYKNAGDKDYTYTTTFTGNTYSVTMTDARAGRRVLCRVYDKYGNVVKSESVLLSQAVRITKQPTSVVVKNGEKATVKVTAVGDGLTYRWYYKNKGDKDYTYTASFTGNTYSVTMTDARAGRRVLCRVYDKHGNVVKSESVVLAQAVRITKQPVSVTVAEGKTAKVTVTALGDGLTYKWYFKNPDATKFSLTTSFTGNIYSVKMNDSRDDRQVYCVVTDQYGNTVKTVTVTLKMS